MPNLNERKYRKCLYFLYWERQRFNIVKSQRMATHLYISIRESSTRPSPLRNVRHMRLFLLIRRWRWVQRLALWALGSSWSVLTWMIFDLWFMNYDFFVNGQQSTVGLRMVNFQFSIFNSLPRRVIISRRGAEDFRRFRCFMFLTDLTNLTDLASRCALAVGNAAEC